MKIKSVSLALTISSVWYTDTSDDATGTFGPGTLRVSCEPEPMLQHRLGTLDLLRYQMNLGAIISVRSGLTLLWVSTGNLFVSPVGRAYRIVVVY